jgi:hypothetical protein
MKFGNDQIEELARETAEGILRSLANRDLIYAHHGGINARGEQTYKALADMLEGYRLRANELEEKT